MRRLHALFALLLIALFIGNGLGSTPTKAGHGAGLPPQAVASAIDHASMPDCHGNAAEEADAGGNGSGEPADCCQAGPCADHCLHTTATALFCPTALLLASASALPAPGYHPRQRSNPPLPRLTRPPIA